MSQVKKGRILITGASGMLGKALVDEFRHKTQDARRKIIPTDINVILSDSRDTPWRVPTHKLDVASGEATQKIIDLNPNLVIHLASYTDVDGCELEPERAWKVNSIGTRNVVVACQKLEAPILYISTDYVFDGEKPTPYLEWDPPNPINIYGQTKLGGELWIARLLKKYWILRTSGLYGKGGKNFVTAILEKAKRSQEIKVVADQIGSPTYTKDLALAIKELICRGESPTRPYGIYHITNSGWASWYEFATTIVGARSTVPLRCKVLPISSSELMRPAKRPMNWRLQNFMWERTFGRYLRHWREALNEYLKSNR